MVVGGWISMLSAALVFIVFSLNVPSVDSTRIQIKYVVWQTRGFYDHIGQRLPKKGNTGFHSIISRKDISKEKIEQQIARWAMVMRGRWSQVTRGLAANLAQKHKARIALIQKKQTSAAAKAFLQKDADITFNKKLTWIQTCRQKNDLVRAQSQAVIDELKLYLNSYCLEDSEARTLAKIHGANGQSSLKMHQLSEFSLIYTNWFTRYFHTYTTALSGRKRNQVMAIIMNQKLSIGQVKQELGKWAAKTGEQKLHEKLLAYLKAMHKRRLDDRNRMKWSKEGMDLKLKELEIHFTDSLTLIEMCKKQNELMVQFGPHATKETQMGLNPWCFGNVEEDLRQEKQVARAPSASRQGIITRNHWEYVVNRPLPSTYLNQFLIILRGPELAQARRILRNRRLTKRQITIEIERLAKRLGGDAEKKYRTAVETETERRHRVESARRPLLPELTPEAQNLSRLEIEITFNDQLSLYDQCVERNNLLQEFGDEAANELKLAVNLWCSKDHPIDSDDEEDDQEMPDHSEVDQPEGGHPKDGQPRDGKSGRKPAQPSKRPQKPKPKPSADTPKDDDDDSDDSGRVIKIDETYESYSIFLSQLDDTQLSEVELIIRDESLPREDVLKQLKEWAEQKNMKKQYEELTIVISEREKQREQQIESTKISKESQRCLLQLKEVEEDHQLTARDSCQRRNEVLFKCGDKVAAEVGLMANQWCMGVEAKTPEPAPITTCNCDVSVTFDDE